jgi:hypothetical protein
MVTLLTEIGRWFITVCSVDHRTLTARHIQRIQKAMTQMNIQLAKVLSDVSGMTGQAIIKAILAGDTLQPVAGIRFRYE